MNNYQNSVSGNKAMSKNRNEQKIKQMPAGVKRFHAPAPEHRAFKVGCEDQKIKKMPPVTHYVGGGGSRAISPNTRAPGQKIR